MTMKDAIKKAIDKRDICLFSRITDQLRDRGLNYQETFRMVTKVTGMTLPEFEELMAEVDDYANNGGM